MENILRLQLSFDSVPRRRAAGRDHDVAAELSGPAPSKLIGRYARRMLIENDIDDEIEFIHMDALSSVAMKVNCDLQLTPIGSSLYRLLAARISRGHESAKSRHLYRDFIDATASLAITGDEFVVTFQRCAHNTLQRTAGFDATNAKVRCLGGKRLRPIFDKAMFDTSDDHLVKSKTKFARLHTLYQVAIALVEIASVAIQAWGTCCSSVCNCRRVREAPARWRWRN
jgi:hypothetical protein